MSFRSSLPRGRDTIGSNIDRSRVTGTRVKFNKLWEVPRKDTLLDDINRHIMRALLLRRGKGEEIPGRRNWLSKDVEM